jgi:sugar/nucleoside kinase (ribokinase family)
VKRILVAGEINVDLVFRDCHAFPMPGREVLADDFVVTPGSSSMICAMGLARLGNPVAFVGRTGMDSWGDYCVAAMNDAGIDTSGILRDAALRTGVTASLSTAQDRALVTFAGATTALRADDITDAQLQGANHLHLSSYYLQTGLRPDCHALFARARSHGLTTSLDPGFDPAGQWGDELFETLDDVDLFLPNDVELLGITGSTSLVDGLKRLAACRARTVVKRGAQGSASFDGEQLLAGPAYPMAAVESTGAGDSFNAGFIHAWLRQRSLADCLRWAGACGSLSTRGVGGTARQANCDEVLALIGSAG